MSTRDRARLDVMVEAGPVTARRQEPHGHGRPRTLFAAAFQDGGAPGGSHQESADLLAAHFDTPPASGGPRVRSQYPGRLPADDVP